jgi:hypothetical protein
MTELTLIVNQADREREVESNLRRRQLLKGSDGQTMVVRTPWITFPRRAASPVQVAER